MNRLPPSFQELLEHLNRLPGVGPKTAQRYLFHLLREGAPTIGKFASALLRVPHELTTCEHCGSYSQEPLCAICSNPRRDKALLAVVADHQDIGAIESTAEFNGTYHVLGGAISPLSGVAPEQLRIKELMARVKGGQIKEVILALNPDMDGEATMLYLNKLLSPLPLKVTRLARGLPMGSDLEYADAITLTDAIRGRRELGK